MPCLSDRHPNVEAKKGDLAASAEDRDRNAESSEPCRSEPHFVANMGFAIAALSPSGQSVMQESVGLPRSALAAVTVSFGKPKAGGAVSGIAWP